MIKDIIIAIDGHSGCGKSTTSKLIAEHFKYNYLDSGAMYRSVTLYFVRKKIDYNEWLGNNNNDIEIIYDWWGFGFEK